MSISLDHDVWVRVEQLDGPSAPRPLPLESGFSSNTAYLVLGLHCPSESSEAFFIVCNDRDEVWFISNRHFRVDGGREFRRRTSRPDGRQSTPQDRMAGA